MIDLKQVSLLKLSLTSSTKLLAQIFARINFWEFSFDWKSKTESHLTRSQQQPLKWYWNLPLSLLFELLLIFTFDHDPTISTNLIVCLVNLENWLCQDFDLLSPCWILELLFQERACCSRIKGFFSCPQAQRCTISFCQLLVASVL